LQYNSEFGADLFPAPATLTGGGNWTELAPSVMYWSTASNGTRFLVQTPSECAQTLARAFSAPRIPVTSERFLAQAKSECPPPPAERGKKLSLKRTAG
jgi:hypothetical protein